MPSRKKYREYRFAIDAYTPETIPMARLAEYIGDLATVLGNKERVHFNRIEPGSTVPVVRVEWEAEPKVRERLRAVKLKEAPQEALDAARRIDRRLADDNAIGELKDPTGGKVLRFPGRELLKKLVFGPITQNGTFQGVPIRVGGEGDPVPVHLEDVMGKRKYIVSARRNLAKEIAQYLFSAVVRVDGIGRWMRHADGEWEMLDFRVAEYHLIEDADVRTNIAALQDIAAEWKNLDDPLAVLDEIKRGKPQ
jgi:hypothetical protein